MDPKKSLEGFRVEKIQPKKKVRSVPKQTYKKGNAILIILFASLIGLTSGIGSAFAFGIKEMPPSSSPLDEPSAKSHVDQVEPSIKQSEIKTSELSPHKPPIDEPTVETAPIDKPDTEEEKVKDSPVTKHKETTSKSSEKSKDDKKIDKQENVTKNNSSTEHKAESTESKLTSEHKQTSTTPNLSDQQTTTPSTKTALSEGKPKTTVPSGNVQTEKQTVQNKPISGNTPNASDSHTKTNSKSIPADQVAVSSEEIPDPKTKPGTLPDTAGNDLNHAVASFVIVCFSIAYLLARKETHPQK